MDFHVLTLFPDMVRQGLNTSIIGRAMKEGHITLNTVNIRDFSINKHNRVDDYPYGGGAGMVIQAEPVYRAWESVAKNSKVIKQGKKPRCIYLTPQGKVFHQTMVEEFAQEEELIFLCGHYEGIDERALELIHAEYLSAGDFVLTGGELPSMVMIDCISRLVPGVLGNGDSAEVESFYDNLLEYPQYTRPEVYEGKTVPQVLLSGHHKNIESWRREQSIRRTLERRPDLLEDAALTLKEQKFLDCLLKEQGESRLKELEQLVKEAVKNEETPGSDREYYQQMKKVKKLLNEKRVTLQELKGYYKVLGALKQEI